MLIKKFLSAYLVVPSIITVSIYLTWRLRLPQVRYFFKALKFAFADTNKNNDNSTSNISKFAAFASIIGTNLGTGNIAGVAIALSTGGPGALFWMWVMGFLGAVIKFSSVYFGVLFRQQVTFKNKNCYKPKPQGGVMYYISYGLGLNKLAIVYGIILLIAALFVGNLVQVNSITLPFSDTAFPNWLVAVLEMLLIYWILSGGLAKFSKFASYSVPFMAVVYLIACLVILFNYSQMIIPSIVNVLHSAFSLHAVGSGIVGFGINEAIQVGFNRGIFSTDAGIGLASIIHAQVQPESKDLNHLAKEQAITSLLAPIISVQICVITGLVLLVTGVANMPGIVSTNACIFAFQLGLGSISCGWLVIMALMLFATMTMLTWAQCGIKALRFLANCWQLNSELLINLFKVLFIMLIPLGAFCNVSFIWDLADLSLNFMVLINLFAIICLLSRYKVTNIKLANI